MLDWTQDCCDYGIDAVRRPHNSARSLSPILLILLTVIMLFCDSGMAHGVWTGKTGHSCRLASWWAQEAHLDSEFFPPTFWFTLWEMHNFLKGKQVAKPCLRYFSPKIALRTVEISLVFEKLCIRRPIIIWSKQLIDLVINFWGSLFMKQRNKGLLQSEVFVMLVYGKSIIYYPPRLSHP